MIDKRSFEEAELRDGLGLLRSIVDVGFFNINLRTGKFRGDPAFLGMWGVDQCEGPLRYEDLMACVHVDDRIKCKEARDASLISRQKYHTNYRIVRTDGTVRHIRGEGKFLFDRRGRATWNIGAAIDVTSQVAADHKVLHLLEHDRLTNLIGRNAFIERLQRAVLHRRDEAFGVLVLDIDRFTALNDTLGSATGDIVLRSFAECLKALERDGHIVGRIGGDEFACLLGGRDEEDLAKAVAKVQSLIQPPIKIAASTLRVCASIGLSVYPFDGDGISLLERAHLACCRSKSAGGSVLTRYEAAMEAEMTRQFAVESSLQTAIDKQQFEVFYQPLVDASTLKMVGVEALVRWNHPQLGRLTPDAFLPAAQRMGMTPFIDIAVLTRACADGVVLSRRAGTPLKIHVNASAATLAHADFVEAVRAALESSGLPARLLAIEITEQALIADEIEVARTLSLLRESGVKASIDDFGTGYNGLCYLRTYAVDSIKIDRTFVQDLDTSSFSRGVCSGIMALAKNLDLEVVAEGVETTQQAEFLGSIGVDEFQGYLYGRPSDLETLLRNYAQRETLNSVVTPASCRWRKGARLRVPGRRRAAARKSVSFTPMSSKSLLGDCRTAG